MKANKLFFCALAVSVLSIHSMSPSDFIAHTESIRGNRAPASEAAPVKKAPAKKAIAKKAVTSKEMKDLQDKLAKLEIDLKNKQDLLDQKTQEVDQLRNSKTDEKIDALTKLIVDQKADIDKLKSDIKNSEVKDVKFVNQSKTSVQVVVCKSESKGEKLEADMKKLLEDKEAVLKQVDGLKKENDDLKLKLTSSVPEVKKDEVKMDEVKKQEIAKADDAAPVEDKKPIAKKQQSLDKKSSDNSDIIALMSQMTTMFSTQMQSQMQIQIQMMNMLSQMQSNMMPQMSPYAVDFSQGFKSPYSLNDSVDLGGWGVGIPSYGSQWSGYQSPFSMMPNLTRQPASQASDFGFSFGSQQAPMMRGFDFNQTPAASQQPHLPELQKQQLLPSNIISA